MHNETVMCSNAGSPAKRVAVVQAGNGQRLDQEMCCILCEEILATADVVESKY